MTTIALDVMGGDLGAGPNVAAAIRLVAKRDLNIILVGDESSIISAFPKPSFTSSRIDILHTAMSIDMGRKPKEAIRESPEASIFEATRLVSEGKADVTVTTGSTGAAIMACARDFKRLPGVRRGVLAAVFPTARTRGDRNDPFALILDSGATLDATASDLMSFAFLGQAYSRCISGHESPKIALLSNGSEPNKGRPAQVEAYKRLSEAPLLNFVGNVEGLDLPKGNADVIVTDGFTGNVVLKLLEGMGDTVADLARYAYRSRWRWRLGLMMLRSGLKQMKSVTDWRQYGGAPVLGFDHLLIKAHGRSNERAITNALKVAHRCAQDRLVIEMEESLAREFGSQK